MKTSIRRQIAAIFIGVMIVIMLLTLFVNTQFLSTYYTHHKQKALMGVYERIEEVLARRDTSYEEMIEELGAITEVGNMMFVIVSEQTQNILTSTSNARQTEEMKAQLLGYMLMINQSQGELLKESEDYQIFRAFDRMNGDEYLEIWGYLSDGSACIIRTPQESIRESVGISNQFLINITIVLAFVGSISIWYFSRRISDPILELADLSKRMANLDFNAKYTSGGEDEIGILGKNFNVMSVRLEQTISELKNANYQLQADIEKKEKMENMRTEFIGNVSHELKTPIALIQGYAEGLKEGISEDPEDRAFYCEVIMDEATKMNKLVQNLLTLNQLELGQEKITFERFNIMELIYGMIQSCDILLQQQKADVRIHAEKEVYVWADEWKVEQVFHNYFSNALHHLGGEGVIDIRVITDEERGKARISVFNTGDRIPEEDLSKIWEKFYKVDKARTREYGGNGIGLSIVKAIMDSFRCEYGVENYKNGVEFWFELDVR